MSEKNDCQYGKVAVEAVKLVLLVLEEGIESPIDAWEKAASKIIKSQSSQKKSCPKNAFLGLCEKGMIRGIKGGSYNAGQKNKKYAIKAVKILRKQPELSEDKKALWAEVSDKSHEDQMDVVISLWNKKLIKVEADNSSLGD